MKPISDKNLRQKQQAARTHGIAAMVNRGDVSLTPPQRTRYAELQEQFKSEPGRLEYRARLATFLAELCELGFSQLKIDTEAGKDIWAGPGVLRVLGTYVNSLTRLLDAWPKETRNAAIEAAEVLREYQGGQDAPGS